MRLCTLTYTLGYNDFLIFFTVTFCVIIIHYFSFLKLMLILDLTVPVKPKKVLEWKYLM